MRTFTLCSDKYWVTQYDYFSDLFYYSLVTNVKSSPTTLNNNKVPLNTLPIYNYNEPTIDEM